MNFFDTDLEREVCCSSVKTEPEKEKQTELASSSRDDTAFLEFRVKKWHTHYWRM